MFVVDSEGGRLKSLPAGELTPARAKALSSSLARRITAKLAQKESYAREIARSLRVAEQKVYYHVQRLEAAGIISATRKDNVRGGGATYYALTQPALVTMFAPMMETAKLPSRPAPSILSHFIKDGALDAKIIVGSPDPHGPKMARSKDAHQSLDLMLLLGSYLGSVREQHVRLDTEVAPEDLSGDIIVIGGPIVNAITRQLNSRMPVFFDEAAGWAIRSTLSGKVYTSEVSGLVVLIDNPWNPSKKALVIAGSRHGGTRAVVLAFLRHLEELDSGNVHDDKVFAKVIEGVDLDGNGIVDEARIVE